MAVELELPVGPRGEPVVVVAVQDDGGVGPIPEADSNAEKSSRPAMSRRMPSASWLVQFQADRARDMALLVRRGVDIDLDEPDVRVLEVRERPVAVDERLSRWRRCDGSCRFSPLPAWPGPAGRDAGRSRGFAAPRVQPPDVGRSRRLNSVSRSVHDEAVRWAWRTTHGSTRLESSMAIVAPRRPVLDDDARRIPVVGHPVGLERQRDVGHDRRTEPPVEVRRVQPVDDVGRPGSAARARGGRGDR